MTSGASPRAWRRWRKASASRALRPPAAQLRGLEEKIWKASQPSSLARSAACSKRPAIEVWIPMRTGAAPRLRSGQAAGAGVFFSFRVTDSSTGNHRTSIVADERAARNRAAGLPCGWGGQIGFSKTARNAVALLFLTIGWECDLKAWVKNSERILDCIGRLECPSHLICNL